MVVFLRGSPVHCAVDCSGRGRHDHTLNSDFSSLLSIPELHVVVIIVSPPQLLHLGSSTLHLHSFFFHLPAHLQNIIIQILNATGHAQCNGNYLQLTVKSCMT
ncbi:hypothetical protein OTU49_006735 [Cherax quadricarinatus]|uniref:Uncharacterized protein n=1 Tax=Cherax quadricarinatus TaxID=27406 RepID=A0AAW0X1J0_CHEQU